MHSAAPRVRPAAQPARGHALVFAEVALASVLLIGCALMLRSFAALIHTSPGFSPPENVVTADAAMSKDRYPEKPQMLAFYRNSLGNMRALPGVKRAAMITHLPFGGNDWGNSFEVEGRPSRDSTDSAQIRPIKNWLLRHAGHSAQGRRRFQRTR